jgi:hypothetical protein
MIVVVASAWGCAATGVASGAIRISPAAIEVHGPDAQAQIIVWDTGPDGRSIDVTRQAKLEALDPAVAAIDERGLISPRGEGRTEIAAHRGAEEARAPLVVDGLAHPKAVSFERQITPLLTKAGCNAGTCHGKAEGQNGFKLSVFGYDPQADVNALVKEGRGRRVFLAAPEHSLLLLKASNQIPHGGGRRIEPDGRQFQLIKRWISEGAQLSTGDSTNAIRIEVEPREQVLDAGQSQQLRVTAIADDGSRTCVTADAEYSSNAEPIARCDARGLVEAGQIAGEAAILVRYRNQVALARITLPRAGAHFSRPAEANFIDRRVWNQLERLGIEPSPPADDATFLRRVFLDTIGTLPTAAEARAFLTSTDPDRRARLIDSLLDREEYADYWSMFWSDILRVDKSRIGPQAAVAMTRWLRRQFAENRPYDEMVRELIAARGSTTAEGPAAFYKAVEGPEALARSTSQVFLGVRIECAQCHHHPFERWGQEDYFALTGFFTSVRLAPLATGGELVFAREGHDLNHPRTGATVPTRALGAAAEPLDARHDRRERLAQWMTAPENPYFARALANRLWAHYFGRGLVMPIDDLRATNPASNELVLDELSNHLRGVKYDLKAFTRTLLNSHVYQLSSAPSETNAADEQNFSHAAEKPLGAEILLDAISQATGAAEKFNGLPQGVRAIQIWDSQMPSYFLRVFGRPTRTSVCECERSNDPSIAQVLHLMNSPEVLGKIQSAGGRARQLAASETPASAIIEELYLSTLSRLPQPREMAALSESFASSTGDRREAIEDLLWALLNSREFLSIR